MNQDMAGDKFKILSIDGGGIKGVFPAFYLMLIESELEKRNDGKTKICHHFDLISGTSTGGIIALALSLGIPAKEIYRLYVDNVKKIFGQKKRFLSRLYYSAHDRSFLERLVRDRFKEYNDGKDPRLKDAKTGVCIPVYDLVQGNPSVLKSPYHESFTRDYQIPMYQVAMATAAAPTYFDPYSASYVDLNGTGKTFANKVDGGVMANNPTLVALLEATKAFGAGLSNLEILSIGTGHRKFSDIRSGRKWGLNYWMLKNNRKRLIELFMQGQSQLVANYISLLHRGIDKREPENFIYDRVDVELNESTDMEMDESNVQLVKNFAELASIEHQHNGTRIMNSHFY